MKTDALFQTDENCACRREEEEGRRKRGGEEGGGEEGGGGEGGGLFIVRLHIHASILRLAGYSSLPNTSLPM